MVSKLAKQTVEQWQTEGLRPTFEDVVKLNALGLRVERGGSAYEFGAVPRTAFLGDYVFTEPTVAKRIWIDQALAIVRDDYANQLFLTAFALNCPAKELPELDNAGKLAKAVERFRDEVLIRFTETQIVACLEYALVGSEPDLGEDSSERDGKVSDLPECAVSAARQVLLEAVSYGIGEQAKDDLTLPQLEKAVMLAAMHSGADVLKGEHAQAVGRFYQACGKIHERLMMEKGGGNGEG